MSDEGPGPAIAAALVVGTVATLWAAAQLLTWVMSAALVLVQG